MSDWRIHGEVVLFDAEIYTVAGVDIVAGSVAPLRRHVVRHPGSVAVLAIDAYGRVALVRPYRPPFDCVAWEVPAGRVEGSDPSGLIRDAERELAEEVGVRARNIEQVMVFRNSPGHSDQLTTVFRATGLSPIDTRTFDPEERDMPVVWVDPADAMRRICEFGPPDAKSLIALSFVNAD